jgi:plasmid stability protein
VAQLTVRNLDDELVRLLKIRAAHKDRSAEAEHRAILEETLRPVATDFWQRADELRQRLAGRALGDSAEIVRRERDRRAGLTE